jgi:hypothetical protein
MDLGMFDIFCPIDKRKFDMNRYTHSIATSNGSKRSYGLSLDHWIAPERIE